MHCGPPDRADVVQYQQLRAEPDVDAEEVIGLSNNFRKSGQI
jgi:hypothetical protein